MAITKVGRFYHYDFTHHGKRFKKSTEQTSITLAREVELAARKAARTPGPAITDITFNALAEEYLKLHAAKKRGAKFFEQTVPLLVEHFDERRLSEITPRDVEQFDSERRTAVKASTANRSLAVLKHMFKLAIRWRFLAENPAAEILLEKEPPGRERYLERAEADRLLEACPAWLRPIVLAALHTGARQGELLALTWADVDLERKLLHFRLTKNGEGRRVRMSATLAAALKAAPSRLAAGSVFLNREGEPLVRQGIRQSFTSACNRAGVPGLRFHDLRHSAASFWVQGGIPLNTVRDMLGHKSLTMTLRYAHLAPDHHAEAAAVMDAIAWTPTNIPTSANAAT